MTPATGAALAWLVSADQTLQSAALTLQWDDYTPAQTAVSCSSASGPASVVTTSGQ